MENSRDDLTRELLEMIRMLPKTMSKLKKGPARIPVFKPSEAEVIGFIHKFGDENSGVNPSQIGDFMGLSRPAVTAILNSLQKKGCIERRLSASDRRMFEIYLTPESREKVDNMMTHIDNYVLKLLDKLGDDDCRELVRIVNKVIDIIDNDINAANK